MATQAMQALQPWRMVWRITTRWPMECTLPQWVPSRSLAKVPYLSLLVLHEAAGRAFLLRCCLQSSWSDCSMNSGYCLNEA